MLFSQNARVAYIGDSITHTAPTTNYIQEYYWKHLKDRHVKVFNLGTGTGYSVLDMVKAFERVNGVPVPYKIGPRRGDAAELAVIELV